MTEPQAPLSVSINPLKYLDRLPEFSGDYRDLQTFINLVDRVHPILTAYDEPSQYLFSDIIKSKLKGKARETIEINCQAQSWAEIKAILLNNFGDRLSLEELFDRLKGVTFRTNCVEFYNELKQRLRSLNNKTVAIIGTGSAANECAKNNMRTALGIFKEKMPEPMKTILICRNPASLEEAMEILFKSGHAYARNPSGPFETKTHDNRKTHQRQNQEGHQDQKRTFPHQTRQRHRPQPLPNYERNFRQPQNQTFQGSTFNRNFLQQRPYQPPYIPPLNRFNSGNQPEPMDIGKMELAENFQESASGTNYHL